ncbi:MAG: hypothetical protein PVI90_13670 [Desulfobacteraceae bacterium]|jgi:hypothetical protein
MKRIRKFSWIVILSFLLVITGCFPTDFDQSNDSDGSNSNDTNDTGGDFDGNVQPDLILEGAGSNVDSPAFWIGENLSESLLLVTAKGNNMVEIWRYPFNQELDPLTFDSEVNGIAVDQANDLLYLTTTDDHKIHVYKLPDCTHVDTFGGGIIGEGENNLALFQRKDGSTLIYVTDDHTISFFDEDFALQGQFSPDVSSMETLVIDEFHEIVYVPEEWGQVGNEGIFAFLPDGTPYSQDGTNRFGKGHFQGDEEGITIYRILDTSGNDTGNGYIIVADQQRSTTEFEFFDRKSWGHVGILTIDSVNNTDGIASTQITFSEYSAGIFAAVDDDTNTIVVGWKDILDAMNL